MMSKTEQLQSICETLEDALKSMVHRDLWEG